MDQKRKYNRSFPGNIDLFYVLRFLCFMPPPTTLANKDLGFARVVPSSSSSAEGALRLDEYEADEELLKMFRAETASKSVSSNEDPWPKIPPAAAAAEPRLPSDSIELSGGRRLPKATCI